MNSAIFINFMAALFAPTNIKIIFSSLSLTFILALGQSTSSAQQQNQQTAPDASARVSDPSQSVSQANQAAYMNSTDERYRIGAGDVLDIRVFNRPQLSRDAVRVDGRGMIRMPLIEEDVQAGCRTEGELARDIANRYRKYQRNPQVDVFVKEFQSQPVALIGAVEKPGRFQLQRRVRLLELLTFGGGPIDRAGGRIHLIRAAGGLRCEIPESETNISDAGSDEGLMTFNLGDTLRGEDKSNPFVRPGDVVSIPEAEQAFVVGNVYRPATIPLKETITVSRAIAMAGGILPDTKSDKIRILRPSPSGSTRNEILVDLKAIDKRQAPDIALRAGDIVDVPTSGSKRLVRSLIGAIAPAISQLPVRVVP